MRIGKLIVQTNKNGAFVTNFIAKVTEITQRVEARNLRWKTRISEDKFAEMRKQLLFFQNGNQEIRYQFPQTGIAGIGMLMDHDCNQTNVILLCLYLGIAYQGIRSNRRSKKEPIINYFYENQLWDPEKYVDAAKIDELDEVLVQSRMKIGKDLKELLVATYKQLKAAKK